MDRSGVYGVYSVPRLCVRTHSLTYSPTTISKYIYLYDYNHYYKFINRQEGRQYKRPITVGGLRAIRDKGDKGQGQIAVETKGWGGWDSIFYVSTQGSPPFPVASPPPAPPPPFRFSGLGVAPGAASGCLSRRGCLLGSRVFARTAVGLRAPGLGLILISNPNVFRCDPVSCGHGWPPLPTPYPETWGIAPLPTCPTAGASSSAWSSRMSRSPACPNTGKSSWLRSGTRSHGAEDAPIADVNEWRGGRTASPRRTRAGGCSVHITGSRGRGAAGTDVGGCRISMGKKINKIKGDAGGGGGHGRGRNERRFTMPTYFPIAFQNFSFFPDFSFPYSPSKSKQGLVHAIN